MFYPGATFCCEVFIMCFCFIFFLYNMFLTGRETCLFKDNLKHLHLSQPEKRGSLLSKVNIFGISVTLSIFLCDFPA